MNLKEVFTDKSTKSNDKVEIISDFVLNGEISLKELIHFASLSKDPIKANCIEALEFSTQKKSNLLDQETFDFVTENLSAKAPRIKWESAKVIGNTAKHFPENLYDPITKLIENTTHEGTVVRWSAAFALSEILNINENLKNKLLPSLKDICEKEEKNSIKKIYQKAIKVAEK
ncbi:hypothetical protein SAMN05880574_11251 [Chryseobacterium sp. RU37D]|uniref:HEAT repeat domain-containing protein n=1 Tax=Chryseobacterium sp. RU37D TaxID=1907397 RepID=UPI000955DE0D|nr:HEAT repeat domain-containing protein [Chryseobacterium sp. RU37D]SIQ41050.1 hypothetical protein SAMN05880574_11251 [Chryseobacterium sp. RU37D]